MTGTVVARWIAVLLPGLAALGVYQWAEWCFAGEDAPSGTVAVAVGAGAILVASAAFLLLVGGAGGFFGALMLAFGLLLTVAATDQATARGEVAACVVRKTESKIQTSFGEGVPDRTLYRHLLDCPGGYPAELADDHRLAPDGGEIRVAFDPRRRVSPAVEGDTRPWTAGLLAAFFLAFSTALAVRCAE
jgi:hypothetical protein